MVTSNERKGLIAVIVLLSVLVLIVVCTQRCGSEPENTVNTALTDSIVTNDSICNAVNDTVMRRGKYHRERKKSSKNTSGSSYKERDPLAEDEYVSG